MANDETGELLLEKRLDHQSGEAREFYRDLQGPVRAGIEATRRTLGLWFFKGAGVLLGFCFLFGHTFDSNRDTNQ